MDIPKGLYEVITSKTLSLDQKVNAVSNFARGVIDLDNNTIEAPAIAWEDAELIIEALKNGMVFDAEDPASFTAMTCNKCGKVDTSYKPDLSKFDMQENAQQALEFVKKHYEKLGWKTSWGHDLCPDCAAANDAA